jgi:hypothetical protein
MEMDDVRSMVETIIRVRADRSDALAAVRRLVRLEAGWSAVIEVGLSGAIDLRRLPRSCASAVLGLDRVRVVPRSPAGDGRAIAAIERFEDEDNETRFDLRPFVSRFAAVLPLGEEVRLSLVAGDRTVAELVPFGGEGHDAAVLALEVEELDPEGLPQTLRLLGPSPVRTAKPKLALAVEPSALDSLSFSGDHHELGCCGARHIVVFSGAATLTTAGIRTSWRTGAENDETGRMVLVGDAFQGVREHVFRGLPQVWIEQEGRNFIAPHSRLRWRALGNGPWQALGEGEAYGRIHIAYVRDDEIAHQTTAAIVPPALTLQADRAARRLDIDGIAGASVGAVGHGQLPVRSTPDTAIVDLANLSPGGTLRIALRWRSELNISLTDPLLERAILDPSGHALAARSTLAVDELQGYRLVSAAGERLCLELVASDASPICLLRPIYGEVPLTVLADDVARLIGGSDDIDSEVRLSWLGSTGHSVSIRWYAESPNPFMSPAASPFSALAAVAGLRLKAFSLIMPTAGVSADLTRDAPEAMARRLTRDLAPGPWLIYGHRAGGGAIRPRILEPVDLQDEPVTLLARAIADGNAHRRRTTLDELLTLSADLPHEDRRLLIDLVVLARREEVPYCALDALDALARSPRAAVMTLLSCETLEERSAVLDLQRELPFLWCSTCFTDWHAAVEARLSYLQARLVAAQLPLEIAERTVASALAEILTIQPEITVHVATVVLCHLATCESSAGDEATQRILRTAAAPIDVEGLVARLFEQHGQAIPPQLFPDDVLNTVRAAWEPYNPAFAHILAAPRIAAEHAAGVRDFPARIIRRCRDSWAYDPYFFERAVPFELQRMR